MTKDDEAFQKFKEALFLFLVIKLRFKMLKGEVFDATVRRFWDADPGAIEETFFINTGIELLPNDIIVMRLLADADITDEIIARLEKIWFTNASFDLFPRKEKK